MSNNGLMIYKNKYISFINKSVGAACVVMLMIVLVACVRFMFLFWSELPIIIKVIGPTISAIISVAILLMPLNGMFITKNGTIVFVPDFRVKKTCLAELKRLSFNFNEWENNKYSVTVKFVYKDGAVFIKDYLKQFRSMNNKKLAMSMYTIKKQKVDKICETLVDLGICCITIIDKDSNIIYQNK